MGCVPWPSSAEPKIANSALKIEHNVIHINSKCNLINSRNSNLNKYISELDLNLCLEEGLQVHA